MNKYEVQQVIQKWVADNFGDSEAEDPSWNIEALAEHVAQHFTEKERCNGWSNYATWRVKLELLDSEIEAIREEGEVFSSVQELADHLEQHIQDWVDMETDPSDSTSARLLTGYINAFLEDVNWREIAEVVASDNPKFVKAAKK